MPDPQSSLTVLGGPLEGQKLVLEDAVDEILIGSDPDCRLCLELPGVSPIHARIWMDLSGIVVHDTHSPRGIYVNDVQVQGQAPLHDGDILWLGPPGDEASVMIQCSFAAPGAGAASAAPMSAEEPSPLDGFLIEEPGGAEAPPSTPAAAPGAVADQFFVEDESLAAPTGEPASGESTGLEDLVFESGAAATAEPAPIGAFDEFLVDEPSAAAPQAAPPQAPAAAPTQAPAAAPPQPPAAAPPHVPTAAPPQAPAAAPTQAPAATPARAAAAPVPARARAPAPATPPAPAPAATTAQRPAPAVRKHDTSLPSIVPATLASGAVRAEHPTPALARATRAPAKAAPRIARYAAIGGVALAVLATGAFVVLQARQKPRLAAVNPSRVHGAQTIALAGSNFGTDPQNVSVLFGAAEGIPERTGTVRRVSPTQIEVVVPELVAAPGRDTKVPVRVRVGSRESAPLEVAAYQAPRIDGLSPEVAMSGEEVVLAGGGWRLGAAVRFGTTQAEILETTPTTLRVRVPVLAGAPGTIFAVKVTMGADESNDEPFLVGHLPLVTGVEPMAAAPGDLVTIRGRGFGPAPTDDFVRIGGAHALIASAAPSELKVVVPRLPASAGGAPASAGGAPTGGAPAGGETDVEVRVRGLENAGQARIGVAPLPETVGFHFVAEPFDDERGHEHAQLTTDLGPAFVLAASGGKSAGQRAVEAARRLNEAAVALKASRDQDIEVRGIGLAPALGLSGKPDVLLEVTEEDAVAYNEDWTKLGGRGGPVTRDRLATWWGALARDLVLLVVRGEMPRYAAALAADGRVLGEVFQAAKRTGAFGVPRAVAEGIKPPMRETLRVLGLRVPSSVVVSVPETAPLVPLKLEGVWTGWEAEGAGRKYVTVTFRTAGGVLAYEGTVTVSVPIQALEQQKGTVRFLVQTRGNRYYAGRWDGEKIAGKISSDPSGNGDIGSFELAPGR